MLKSVGCILLLALATPGCTSKSKARLQAQNAFLTGQNVVLRQQAQATGVTVVGAVQNPNVPWVAGLTLTQAIATAQWLGVNEPQAIIITRQGESATLEPKVLFDGPAVPLEPGDVVELR